MFTVREDGLNAKREYHTCLYVGRSNSINQQGFGPRGEHCHSTLSCLDMQLCETQLKLCDSPLDIGVQESGVLS